MLNPNLILSHSQNKTTETKAIPQEGHNKTKNNLIYVSTIPLVSKKKKTSEFNGVHAYIKH